MAVITLNAVHLCIGKHCVLSEYTEMGIDVDISWQLSEHSFQRWQRLSNGWGVGNASDWRCHTITGLHATDNSNGFARSTTIASCNVIFCLVLHIHLPVLEISHYWPMLRTRIWAAFCACTEHIFDNSYVRPKSNRCTCEWWTVCILLLLQ